MNLDIIKSITGHSLSDHVHDWHYDSMAWLDNKGFPVILTADLKDLHQAWYGITYTNKVWNQNPVKYLANCFDMFGGPVGTLQELTQELRMMQD